MLQGALIGLIVGVIMTVVILLKRQNVQMQALTRAFDWREASAGTGAASRDPL